MRPRNHGLTLMEIIVVLVIIGIAIVCAFPSFTAPMEQARAANAKNNLLAIYSAEQNYLNNYNSYCTTSNTPSPEPSCSASTCAPDIISINCNLSQNIQDDGTYTYACQLTGGVPTCTATRTSIAANNTIVVTLNQPIDTSGDAAENPVCNLIPATWCP